jgi:hypothetical protein
MRTCPTIFAQLAPRPESRVHPGARVKGHDLLKDAQPQLRPHLTPRAHRRGRTAEQQQRGAQRGEGGAGRGRQHAQRAQGGATHCSNGLGRVGLCGGHRRRRVAALRASKSKTYTHTHTNTHQAVYGFPTYQPRAITHPVTHLFDEVQGLVIPGQHRLCVCDRHLARHRLGLKKGDRGLARFNGLFQVRRATTLPVRLSACGRLAGGCGQQGRKQVRRWRVGQSSTALTTAKTSPLAITVWRQIKNVCPACRAAGCVAQTNTVGSSPSGKGSGSGAAAYSSSSACRSASTPAAPAPSTGAGAAAAPPSAAAAASRRREASPASRARPSARATSARNEASSGANGWPEPSGKSVSAARMQWARPPAAAGAATGPAAAAAGPAAAGARAAMKAPIFGRPAGWRKRTRGSMVTAGTCTRDARRKQ